MCWRGGVKDGLMHGWSVSEVDFFSLSFCHFAIQTYNREDLLTHVLFSVLNND